MHRPTLFNAKSTIWHSTPSLITRQRALVDSKCYRHREMLDITTYLNDNTQTPLVWFVVYTLYNKLCSSDKSNSWSLCLSVSHLYRPPSKVKQTAPWSVGESSVLLIPASSVRWRNFFYKSTVAQTKMRNVSKTTPLLGVICFPFDKT